MSQFSTTALSWLCLVLQERFGHTFTLEEYKQGFKLKLADTAEGNIFFPHLEPLFQQSRSDLPCSLWDAEAEGWYSVLGTALPAPGVAELPSPLITLTTNEAIVRYDILGLTYWMLNRIEEIGRTDLDNHGRFPAINSHAYLHDYLERPVVDEWLHILGQVIKKVWPRLELTKHQFSMKVSHDVDSPSRYGFCSAKSLVRGMAGDVLRRGDIKGALLAPWIRFNTSERIHPADSFNTFDWIMDQSEQQGLKSAFYFICGRTSKLDADYEPEHPAIRDLMRRIYQRGHEIGLHPSYGTYQNPELIKQEAQRLKQICDEEGIEQTQWGGRMHYLRWEHPTTLQAWDDAGMDYDATLSYADWPGFRCGTCFEYTAFNPKTQKQLSLRIKPLIAMECTVIADRYMGLGYSEEAEDKFLKLKEKCRRVNGCFALLWHNSHLINKVDKDMYKKIVRFDF